MSIPFLLSASSDVMSLAIADYLLRELETVGALDGIRMFVRGTLPPGIYSIGQFPVCEAFVREADDLPGQLGQAEYLYRGHVRILVSLTATTANDNPKRTKDRARLNVPSYTYVTTMIKSARDHLQACDHRALGDLVVDGESVCYFQLEKITYGLAIGQQVDSWSNFGMFTFVVNTIRGRDA